MRATRIYVYTMVSPNSETDYLNTYTARTVFIIRNGPGLVSFGLCCHGLACQVAAGMKTAAGTSEKKINSNLKVKSSPPRQ